MVLNILFGILAFLTSTFGIMAILLGLVLFLGLPVLSMVTRWKGIARFYLKLATLPLKRGAVVISEHNDALFKTMRYSGIGVEKITIDDEEKLFEDPDNALHHFLGIPFAFADEEHGILFDPRHAAVGQRKQQIDDHNEERYLATEEEWQQFGVSKWVPGVFALPAAYELVDLSAVQTLIEGGERSEYAKRVEELYKHSRAPFQSGSTAAQFIYPILGLLGTFGGIWILASQIGLPSVGGGPSSSVSFGVLMLLLSLSRPSLDTLKAVDWRKWASLAMVILTPVAIFAGLYLFTGLIITLGVLVGLLLGFLILPILTFLAKPSQLLGGLLSSLYFKLGFFGYRQPVITWTQSKYVVKEESELETTGSAEYYDLFGHVVGVSYEPGPESWNAEPIAHSELDNRQPVTDGGVGTPSNLPSKYVRSDESRDEYGAYLPKRIRDDHYYLHSGIALERLKHAANGDKSMKKLLEAKEEHGDTDAVSDSLVLKATVGTSIIGFVAGFAVFILPAFL